MQNVERIAAVLADHWDELPAYFGDGWISVLPQIADLSHQLRSAGSADHQALLAMRLALLFRGHPVAAPLLSVSTESQRSSTSLPVSPTAGGLAALRDRIAATAASRYTEIFAPERMRVGERGVLTVRLTRTELAASVAPAHLPAGDRFEVRLHAPSFVVEGNPVRALDITSDADSETAVFYLTAIEPSTNGVSVDVLHGDLIAATRHVPVAVESSSGSTAGSHTSVQVVPASLEAADIELRILQSTQDGAPVLSFYLHSPSGSAGYHHFHAGDVKLAAPPEEYQQRVLGDLERRHGTRGARRQRAVGYQLYRELLPAELRAAYRELTRKPLRTMHITSDEPWIPWELVLPDEDGLDDDFWCIRFELTRWLAGPSGPPRRVTARSLAFLDASAPPNHPPLPAVADERAHLTRLARRFSMADRSPAVATSDAIDQLLDNACGELGLWHFGCHGDVSSLILADGVRLTPDELAGPRQSALRDRRPLVFLNACRAGGQELSWTGLGGWASAWTGRCWSPFVGPLWSVTDAPAAFLAARFYDELAHGAPIGAAMTCARKATRQQWPEDSTWLAYSVYAHPNTTVAFGRATT